MRIARGQCLHSEPLALATTITTVILGLVPRIYNASALSRFDTSPLATLRHIATTADGRDKPDHDARRERLNKNMR
jgi:hypothetical protein